MGKSCTKRYNLEVKHAETIRQICMFTSNSGIFSVEGTWCGSKYTDNSTYNNNSNRSSGSYAKQTASYEESFHETNATAAERELHS